MGSHSQVLFDSLLEAGGEGVALQEAYQEEQHMEGLNDRRDEPVESENYVWDHPNDSSLSMPGEIEMDEAKLAEALDTRQMERTEAISFLNPFYNNSQSYEVKDTNFRLPQLATCDHEEELQEAADQVYEEWNQFSNGVPTNQFLMLPPHHQHTMVDSAAGYSDLEYQMRRRYSMVTPAGAGYDLPLLGGHRPAGSNLQFVIEDPSGKENFREINPIEHQGRRHSMGAPHLYCCPWTGCNKVFNRFYNLRSHYRIHSGEKPFTCNYCESSFARNHDLKRHERIHLKTKPYICPICNKAFSRNDAMNRHVRLNSCSKPAA